MDEPIWVDRLVVDAVHFDQLQQHCGLPGIRDEDAVEAALARPKNKYAYQSDVDLAALAAAYTFALASSHGYHDGNKRVAFMVAYVFLGLNGWKVDAPEPEVVAVMNDVAEGEVDEDRLATWFHDHMVSTGAPSND